MNTKYKFVDNSAVYFTTSTAAGCTDVFTREMYKTILIDSNLRRWKEAKVSATGFQCRVLLKLVENYIGSLPTLVATYSIIESTFLPYSD